MRHFTFALLFALVAFVSAAAAKHPLAQSKGEGDNTSHALAPKVVTKKGEFIKYFACQIEGVTADNFRNAAFFSKTAYCTSAGMKVYDSKPLSYYLELGYEIVDVEYQSALIRVILRHPKHRYNN